MDLAHTYLLTHSAGLSYEMMSPLLMKYRKSHGKRIVQSTTGSDWSSVLLLYEPGTKWLYGTALDWAGKLVERVTGETLEEYMKKKNIWTSLGITDITFWPSDREITERVGELSIRDAKGSGKVVHEGPAISSTKGCEAFFAGYGAYASMPDYFKILMSLLLDDEKVLKKETTKMMFEPQLNEEYREAQKKLWTDPANTRLFVGQFSAYCGVELETRRFAYQRWH